MPSSNTKLYARFIPREEVGEVTHWKFGAVDGSEPEAPDVAETPEPSPTVDESLHLEQVRQAHDEGFVAGQAQGQADGFAQGHAQASQEWQQRMDEYQARQGQEASERLASVVVALDTSLTQMQQAMANEMLQLACELARQVVRRELRGDSQALVPVVQEALGLLVADQRPAVVRLHPDDFAAFAEPQQAALAASSPVQWLADAAVAPGGCLVESGGMAIDGSLEKRWQKAVAAMGLESAWQSAEPTPEASHGD